jgi:hypothetical protein
MRIQKDSMVENGTYQYDVANSELQSGEIEGDYEEGRNYDKSNSDYVQGDSHREEQLNHNDTKQRLSKGKRALNWGIGGVLVTSHGCEMFLRTTADFDLNKIDNDDIGSFSPLLSSNRIPEERPWISQERLEQIASELSGRSKPRSAEDGKLRGSTKLLWDTIIACVLSRGKRNETLIASSGPAADTFDRRLLNLLAVVPFQDDEEQTDRQIQLPSLPRLAGAVESATALAEMEMLLLSGDHDSAVTHAIQNQLWAHALVISHFISVSSYRRVVYEFASRTLITGTPVNIVFQVLAGRGVEAVQDKSLPLNGWKQVLQAILANRSPQDSSVLRAFGDRLWTETGSVSAAHICYIAGGLTALDAQDRIMLVGGDHITPQATRSIFVTPQAIMRTEAFLFGQSLSPSMVKSDTHQLAVREFQPFRLVFAMWLADMGYREQAKIWVESIRSYVPRKDHQEENDQVFLDQLIMFEARLTGQKLLVQNLDQRRQSEQARSFLKRLHERESPNDGDLMGLNSLTHQQNGRISPPPFDFSVLSPDRTGMQSKVELFTTAPLVDDSLDDSQWSNPFAAAKVTSQAPAVKKNEDKKLAPIPSSPPQRLVHQPLSPAHSQLPSQANQPRTDASNVPRAPPSVPAPLPPTTPIDDASATAPSDSRSSGGWGLGDLRGWLVQKILGVPKNATVAKTGEKLTAYYDEKQKRWIFPGDSASNGPPTLSGPPIVAALANNADNGNPPQQQNVGGQSQTGRPPQNLVRNRYVVAS